jgi:hypothetical protein
MSNFSGHRVRLNSLGSTRFVQAAVCHHTDRTISSSKVFRCPPLRLSIAYSLRLNRLVSTPSRFLEKFGGTETDTANFPLFELGTVLSVMQNSVTVRTQKNALV